MRFRHTLNSPFSCVVLARGPQSECLLSTRYSDSSQGSIADLDAGGGLNGDDDSNDEDDVDSDSYEGDADGQEYAKYVFHAK